MRTDSNDYAQRLLELENSRWKQLLNVQAPYRWNLRRHSLGRTLDVGCGIGRNLGVLSEESVGVDHNAASVAVARRRGYRAYTVEEFFADGLAEPESFDALLLAHVVEHMPSTAALTLLQAYVPLLRPEGKVLFICPQERGYASDPTHEAWTTGGDLEQLARDVGLEPDPWRSFPLPRFAGRWFTYNEFNVLARKPGRDAVA